VYVPCLAPLICCDIWCCMSYVYAMWSFVWLVDSHTIHDVFCVLSFLQCFDTVGWVTGRVSSLKKNLCQSYHQRFFSRTDGRSGLRKTRKCRFTWKTAIKVDVMVFFAFRCILFIFVSIYNLDNNDSLVRVGTFSYYCNIAWTQRSCKFSAMDQTTRQWYIVSF